jgi:hypothetical protein
VENDVVLVGHSYAGMIIPGVVESTPANVRHLVWTRSFRRMGSACWTCFPKRSGIIFERSREGGAAGFQDEIPEALGL